jgi:hypothetical protein
MFPEGTVKPALLLEATVACDPLAANAPSAAINPSNATRPKTKDGLILSILLSSLDL